MILPNLSYMMTVGQLRYIQSAYESPAFRNPDTLVRELLPPLQRWRCDLRGRLVLPKLRSQPFYYYVLARTQYYDSVYIDALCDKVKYIVNIGCGSDTRAYRFGHLLRQHDIRALECDQADAINAKEKLVSEKWSTEHVEYMALDLNDAAWPKFERWLQERRDNPMLVMMEGVSPYVNEDAFGRFLTLLAANLQAGSSVAYDFKLPDVAAGFGLSERTSRPFRLNNSPDEVAAYHSNHGFQVTHVESGPDLSLRLLPGLSTSKQNLFREDCLVRLTRR